jgi:alanine dehydrogenase
VTIETGAGDGIGASDEVYRRAGAIIAESARDILAKSEMIVKVKEPQKSEWAQLRESQILFTYLHLAPDPEQARGLLASGCTAIAYETVTDAAGHLPLLAPMSEVAGRGLLLGGVPGVQPARVVVLGGGVVGTQAARMAAGLGAEVTVIDRSIPRLRELDDLFAGRVRTRFSTIESVEEEVFAADVVIGAVLVPGASAPKLVTRAMLTSMRPGAVLVDVAIDQGGCFETSYPTTHADPTYVVDGVVHYCVANMPGAVPVTSSQALNNATLPFGLMLANKGFAAVLENPHLRNGLNVHRGRITNKAVAESLGLEFAPVESGLAA